MNAVNQCWTQKAPRIRPSELADAKAAYDHAREVYRRLISESAATGCLAEAFRLYKPHVDNMTYLEVRHWDTKYSELHDRRHRQSSSA